MTRAPRALVIDGLLGVMVLIWGANFSIIKRAFEDIPPQPFNALRITLATLLFLGAIAIAIRQAGRARRPVSSVFHTSQPVTRRDLRHLIGLGLIGHCGYQIGFVGGVDRTSVSNAALIIGATPVVIAVLSAALGRERIGRLHWTGIALSLVGIYVIVGLGSGFSGATIDGDLLMMFSVCCWSVYTVGASRLMTRHSPLFVTGITMLAGAIPYVALTSPQLAGLDWSTVSRFAWGALVFSAVFALCVCYLIWYVAVRSIGPSRTAAFANLVPIVAMAVAAVWLREPISATKAVGATAVLTGVFLTRLGRRPAPIPIEE